MNIYRVRNAKFVTIHEVADWRVKVYTISSDDRFTSREVLDKALDNIAVWIDETPTGEYSNYKIACLILHEAREGVFSVLNWWVDENMLKNQVYLTPREKPREFNRISDSGIAFCVWELGIVWHERNAWIKHVLKHPDEPRFQAYLNDTYTGPI